ncbi:hypothetical protein [Clavibacter capsici]|uniref:Uncharacterized protein n=1 Tax=Clavibacter capsici TaxID=1874630 RepID=A0AAE6XNW0_9MICO|nr:hypothetical protein [Clavibacter capsici]ALD11718.1 hypothetical protein AES38_00980 [Clavibacter capsici]QIS43775.1 hypothetical protein GW570_00985 [Clavibacter capsici]
MTPTPLVELRSRTAPSAAAAAATSAASTVEARSGDRRRAPARRAATAERPVAGTRARAGADPGRAGGARRSPDGRRDEIVWRSGRLELRLRRSPDGPVMLTRLVAGSVETHFAHPVPLVEVLVAGDTGAGDLGAGSAARLAGTAVGAALRYVGHSVSADGARLEVVSATPDGIRAAVTLEGRDGAIRSGAVVTNDGASPVDVVAVSSWAAPLGVRLDKGAAADPAADWELLEGRVAGGHAAGWSARSLRDPGLLAEPRGGSVARASDAGPAADGPLPVAALRSERQEVAWLWEAGPAGSWRWEVGEHGGDGHLVVSAMPGGSAEPLAPGASRASAPVLVAVGTDLEDAAAALTRARRSLRPAHAHAASIAPADPDADDLLLPLAAVTAPLVTLPGLAAATRPRPGASPERTASALVAALAGGAAPTDDDDRLDPAQRDLVADAARTADDLRDGAARSVPLWPLGLPASGDRWVAVAHDAGDVVRVAIWDRGDDAGTATLSLPSLLGRRLDVSTAFPRALAAWDADWDAARGILTVGSIPGGPSARLLELRRRS